MIAQVLDVVMVFDGSQSNGQPARALLSTGAVKVRSQWQIGSEAAHALVDEMHGAVHGGPGRPDRPWQSVAAQVGHLAFPVITASQAVEFTPLCGFYPLNRLDSPGSGCALVNVVRTILGALLLPSLRAD